MEVSPHKDNPAIHGRSLTLREGGEGGISPVALFVFNRADNTRKTLKALMANTLAPQTPLYVFSDGGRDETSWKAVREVRDVLHVVQEDVARTHSLLNMTLVERPTNYYLERNIIEGINEVFRHHETAIVLEDDILTSSYFLQFMNDAFRLYRDEQQVMHVSGFTRLSLIGTKDFYFSPFMAGWGWGTWRERWQRHFRHFATRAEALGALTSENRDAIQYGGVFPCLKDLDRQPIPWDICWSIAVRQAQGLCLYPTRTLVRNIGFESGTHYGRLPRWCSRLLQRYEYDREPYQGSIAIDYQPPASDAAIERQMQDALRDWGIRYTWLGRLIRRILACRSLPLALRKLKSDGSCPPERREE